MGRVKISILKNNGPSVKFRLLFFTAVIVLRLRCFADNYIIHPKMRQNNAECFKKSVVNKQKALSLVKLDKLVFTAAVAKLSRSFDGMNPVAALDSFN